MLVYSKIEDLVNVLYGTKNNIPDISDSKIYYYTKFGTLIPDITEYKYFYSKNNYIYASKSKTQVPQNDDIVIFGKLEDGTIVLGKSVRINSAAALTFENAIKI